MREHGERSSDFDDNLYGERKIEVLYGPLISAVNHCPTLPGQNHRTSCVNVGLQYLEEDLGEGFRIAEDRCWLKARAGTVSDRSNMKAQQ